MAQVITIKDLSIGYRSKHKIRTVASSINATLQDSELTCLIGCNGIGKSTLLRTLIGFQQPLAGEIIIKDKSLSDYTSQELAKMIGIVLTTKLDAKSLSVEEIVGIGRSPYTGFFGTLSSTDNNIVAEAIRQIGIEYLAHRNISELSDGERQKVMIAKALAQQTPIIILDEPTSFLDFPSKVEIFRKLRQLAHEQQKTILLSTHDVELSIQLSDRLWLMESNHLAIGTPKELAMNGSLSHFIERDGIRFNKENLKIEID